MYESTETVREVAIILRCQTQRCLSPFSPSVMTAVKAIELFED